MAKVYILCGQIASGKTYYANRLSQSEKAIILSCDDLILSIFDKCLEDKHDLIESRCVDYLCDLAQKIVEAGIDVILDHGFWKKKDREAVKNFFEKKNINCELHFIKAELHTRVMRLEERNKELCSLKSSKRVYIIPDGLRKNLDLKFEEPSVQEINKTVCY